MPPKPRRGTGRARVTPGKRTGSLARGIVQFAASNIRQRTGFRNPQRTARTRGHKNPQLLGAVERRRARRNIKRARSIEELKQNLEAQDFFRAFDSELKQVFGNEYKGFMKRIPTKTLEEIKVMLWNGFFEKAEIGNFLHYMKKEVYAERHIIDPGVFFTEKTREIVKQRRQEFNETGTIQTLFYQQQARAA